MAKFDATERGESGATRIARAVVLGIAVMMSVYHLVTGYQGIGPPIAEIHYPVHLGFALLVLFGGDAVEAMVRRRYTRPLYGDSGRGRDHPFDRISRS